MRWPNTRRKQRAGSMERLTKEYNATCRHAHRQLRLLVRSAIRHDADMLSLSGSLLDHLPDKSDPEAVRRYFAVFLARPLGQVVDIRFKPETTPQTAQEDVSAVDRLIAAYDAMTPAEKAQAEREGERARARLDSWFGVISCVMEPPRIESPELDRIIAGVRPRARRVVVNIYNGRVEEVIL